MARTTPPRPVDIAVLVPELREHTTTATRLHPRPGRPSVDQSSVGGPLRWPADEEWPMCTAGADHHIAQLRTPATVRRSREIYAAAEARAAANGSRYELTEQERAEVPGYDFSEPHSLVRQPIPYVPVAQLYRRDTPDFAGPDDADLMQVLWCPLDHPDEGYNPKVRVFWRRSADIGPMAAPAPEPPVVHDDYLPAVCVVHPEQVREFQYAGLLPDGLSSRIEPYDYETELSLAPGWKVGGFAGWSLTDPHPMDCATCGTAMTLLFTADSAEWDHPDGSWRPVEEAPNARVDPVKVVIGRGYALYVFRCPVSFGHPLATTMQ